jgi:hypothetical protein
MSTLEERFEKGILTDKDKDMIARYAMLNNLSVETAIVCLEVKEENQKEKVRFD